MVIYHFVHQSAEFVISCWNYELSFCVDVLWSSDQCDFFFLFLSPEPEASSEEAPPAGEEPAASSASASEATENGEKTEGAAEEEKADATGKKE